VDEQERRDRLERLDQCIKLGEEAYDQLDEPRTHSSPAGHYSDAKDFFGEAILAAYGGAWSLDEFGWHICFDEENRAYPFSKVGKHFRFGAEDSIAAFYCSIAAFWPS
jgi:hypothetical protein